MYLIGPRMFTWPPPADVLAAGEVAAAEVKAGMERSSVAMIAGIAAAVISLSLSPSLPFSRSVSRSPSLSLRQPEGPCTLHPTRKHNPGTLT